MDLAEDRLAGVIRECAVTIAAASGLDDGIIRAEGAPDGGEIHVHSRLDTLGGDKEARFLVVETLGDLSENLKPMGRIHPGGKVEDAVVQDTIAPGFLREQIEQSASLFTRVENGESLLAWGRKHGEGDGIVVHLGWLVIFREPMIFHALEPFEMVAGVFGGDDGSGVLKPEFEVVGLTQRGLGSGAKDK